MMTSSGVTLLLSQKLALKDVLTNKEQHYSDWVCTAVMSNDVMKDLRG